MGIINHCAPTDFQTVKLQNYKRIEFSSVLRKYFFCAFQLYVLNNLRFALVYIRFFLYIFALRSKEIGLQSD